MTPERRAELTEAAESGLLALANGVVPDAPCLEALEAIVLWFASGGTGPGHWEVKDYADGWIRHDDETRARTSPEAQNGAAVRFVPYVGTLPAR